MAIFEGAGVAIITPMNDDLTINFDKLTELIEEQIAGGTDSIIVCGTTGEASTFSHEEHLLVIKHTCEVVAGRIPVIAGSGSNCTDTAIYLSVEAQRYGADGLLVVSPYYNKATQNGLIEHFTAIAGAVTIPIILYNIPGRTGVTIQPKTIAHLVKNVHNIVGVKEASGNLSAAAELMSLMGDEPIDMYSGNDDQIIPIMSIGGKGVISVLSNVAPKQTHDMCKAMLDGDIKTACKMQIDAIDLIKELFCEVNPIPVKAAMNIMGKKVGKLRLPLTEMEKANQDNLKEAMKKYGLI